MFEEFVLTASTADLSEEPQAREHADAVEFRMDLASDPLAQLDTYDGELPLLVTNRASWEGGEADDLGRYDALTTALTHDAVAAVDIELAALRGNAPEGEESTRPHSGIRPARQTSRWSSRSTTLSRRPSPRRSLTCSPTRPPKATWESWRRPRPRPRTRSR